MTFEESKAYYEGYNSYNKGLNILNPYDWFDQDGEDMLAYHWAKGWDAAFVEDHKE